MIETRKLYSVLLLLFFMNSPAAFAVEPLIFSSPPKESIAKSNEIYKPIAQYLSDVLGREVVYQHPGSWPKYTSNMRSGRYDIVFDGPHFASWRMKYINHKPVIKIPGDFVFVFITKKDNLKIKNKTDLIAKKVCGHPPPNLSTLTLFNQYNNPVRQPTNITINGFGKIYAALLEDKCEGAVLPLKLYVKLEPNKDKTRVVYTSTPLPNQTITVGPKISKRDVTKISAAILSKKGMAVTKKLRKQYAAPGLTIASSGEYQSAYKLLRYSYGFNVY